MSITASRLRELHRIHRQLGDLRDRMERGPKQVRAAEANVARQQLDLEQAKEGLTRTRVTADERQLQLKQREVRIEDLKVKLNTCKSNREYQALKEQIAADEQANSVLSDEILEMLEQLERQQAQHAEMTADLKKSQEELEKVRARVQDQHQQLEVELARVTGQLHEAEKDLPADFRQDYERITKARGDEALAQVEGESCGGCFQTLTPQTMNDLHLSKPVFCKSCGCLLYLPEDRSVGGHD